MSPGNRFIKALAPIPVSPKVTAHSIISVDSDAPLDQAGDGVVKYQSAHVERRRVGADRAQPALRHAGRAGDDRGGAPHPGRALRAIDLPDAGELIESVWRRSSRRSLDRDEIAAGASAR